VGDAASASGPGPGFDDFYAANFVGLTTQLYAYFGDRQEAQDVVQEAFCRALTRWRQISAYEDPVAWVRRVAWNLATSQVRRHRVLTALRRRQRPEHTPPPDPDRVALATAMAKLPPALRQAMVLHYLADLPVAAIAANLNVPVGTVKSWLSRGRTALAAELAPRSPEEVHHG
jgi:RNA polymerase sigma-70 factor (ECF subfamily)